MVEVVDFVEEGQADAFLALDIRERNKKYTYPEIEKVEKFDCCNCDCYQLVKPRSCFFLEQHGGAVLLKM